MTYVQAACQFSENKQQFLNNFQEFRDIIFTKTTKPAMIARPWTDDLPKCKNTCVASYFSRLGGNTNNTDDYLCFYCKTEDNL